MRLLALALFLSFWPGFNMSILFADLEIDDAASVTGVQLVQRAGQAQLLLARGSSLFETTPGKARGLTPAGSVGSPASWDAKPLAEVPGVLATVHVQSESAVAWAMLRAPEFHGDSRLHPETFAVYDHPRFVRGQRRDQWAVTAVRYDNGRSIPTVFPREAFGPTGPQAPQSIEVGSFAQPVQDMRLVQVGNGFWLLVLVADPAAAQDRQPRQLAAGSRMPGALLVQQFDAALQAISQPTALLGTVPVYEFEADAGPADGLVIFATTPEGVVYASGKPDPAKALPAGTVHQTKVDRLLVSPAVLVQGGQAHLAALADAATPKAAVLHGTVPVR
jgi:hypothetical protein